jgi:hypothetical protein
MTKSEKIKESYGDAYEALSPYIDVNGWVRAANLKFYSNGNLPFKTETIVMDGWDWYRPLIIQGINDNNGWTKLESESDLPKSQAFYNFIKQNGDMDREFFSPGLFEKQTTEYYTHWRPISDIRKPIY